MYMTSTEQAPILRQIQAATPVPLCLIYECNCSIVRLFIRPELPRQFPVTLLHPENMCVYI